MKIGEHAIEVLDQVTPIAKEKFSPMESSKGANAPGGAWPEDLPERRTLPPVLCRPRSPSHRKHVRDDVPSDGAEVAVHCQNAMRLTEESKVQEEPSTPAGDCLLQATPPSSVSPHPLSAPPPSPVPTMGLPMLLQPWEVMQDDDAAAAKSPPASAQSHQAASTANQDATLVEDEGASSMSAEAGQSSSASSMDSHEQPLVQNAPPPTLEQKPSPSQMPAVVSPAPPPPTGNISAVLHAKRAASKLKRSAQMGSLYRHLRDRVEGSGCQGGKRAQGKKAKTPAGTKGYAGQGMADALAEMTKRSAYFRQIEEDAENHATAIMELKDAIASFQSKDMAEMVRFHQHVERQLVCLTDETQVLARFEGFPLKKLESLRMCAALYSKLDGAVSTLKGWELLASSSSSSSSSSPVSQQLDKVEGYFNKIKDDVDVIERSKDEEMKRFQSHGIHLDLGVLVGRVKECMVDLSSNCMELALKECREQDHGKEAAAAESSRACTGLSRLLWRVFQLAFRVYNFAGGQDDRADRLTSILAREIEAHPLWSPQSSSSVFR